MQENNYYDFTYIFSDDDRRILTNFILRENTNLSSAKVAFFVEQVLNTLPAYCVLGYEDHEDAIDKAVEKLITTLKANGLQEELNSHTLIHCLRGLKNYLNSRDFPYTANVARSFLGFTWVTASELLKKTNRALDVLD